uniref:Uncharacterized protein n=1 Tax=Oryza brachyantha TaxID=4533 RepID=J3M663_ORYBR
MVVAGEGSASGAKIKGSWSPEEDDLLRAAVARHGPRNWTAISEEVPGRSGKSCRLRKSKLLVVKLGNDDLGVVVSL